MVTNMDNTTFLYNENLRSISAIIAARNKEEKLRRLAGIRSKFSRPSFHGSRIHQSSSVGNDNPTKDKLQPNKLIPTKPKPSLWKSSKVAPTNQTVFYFDDGSDLTMTDVLSTQYGPTKEDRQNMKEMKAKRKCRYLGVLICLFGTLVIGIISAVVPIVLLLPSQTSHNTG